MFSEPYCRVADNYALISNLADLVASAARKGG